MLDATVQEVSILYCVVLHNLGHGMRILFQYVYCQYSTCTASPVDMLSIQKVYCFTAFDTAGWTPTCIMAAYTSWAGQGALNRQISLCPAQFFEFGPEILTRDSEQARRDTTWRAQNKKKRKSVDFSSIS